MADVAVIGAGVGGMAAAIRLAARGHRVRLFESRPEVGGKLAEVRRDGFTFGVGPSLLTLPEVFDELAQEAGWSLSGLIGEYGLVGVDPVCRYLFADESVLNARREPAAMADAVERLAPGEGEAWRRYFAWGGRAWEASRRHFFSGPLAFSPAALRGRGSPADLADLAAIAPGRTLAGQARRFFADPRMLQYACRYATYSGSSPYRAPAALGCVPYLEHAKGAWYVRGGLVRLRDGLARLLAHTGVEVHCGVRVSQLLTTETVDASREWGTAAGVKRPAVTAAARESGMVTGPPPGAVSPRARLAWNHAAGSRVTGVVVAGERVPADVVVAGTDAGCFYSDLLPWRSRRRRVERLGPSSSAFLALCGVVGRTPGLAHHNIVFSADYRAEFADIFGGQRPPADPTIYLGCSAVQEDGQAPAGDENWVILVNVPAGNLDRWQEVADQYLGLILDRLAAAGLDVRGRLRFADTMTPVDFAQRYDAWQGAIYGPATNGRLAPLRRPGNRGPLLGLYLVGGSVHPGGGLPLVVMGSRIVADLVEEDLGRGGTA